MKLYNSSEKLKFGLKRSRKGANLRQAQLVEKLNELDDDKMHYTLKTIQNWEQGISSPTLETLLKLCDFYHCDLDYLVGRIDEKNHDLQFISDYTGLSAESIDMLHEWKNSDDNRNLRPSYIDGIMSHPDFPDLMEKINRLMSHSKIEGIAFAKSDAEGILEAQDMQMAYQYKISNILEKILDSLSSKVIERNYKRWKEK